MECVALYTEKFTERTNDMYYHDAINAVLLFDEGICKMKRGRVHVGCGESDFAYTVFEEDPGGSTLVAYDIDVERFFRDYRSIVNDSE